MSYGDSVKRSFHNLAMSELWKRIREARKEAGMSQPALAKICGVERASVSQWESLKPKGRTTPAINKLEIVAKATNRPLWWFFTTPEEPGPDKQERELVEMLTALDDLDSVKLWVAENLSDRAKLTLSKHLIADVEKGL